MDIEKKIIAALSEAINAPDRPPALWPLAYIKYPPREVQPVKQSDGSYKIVLFLWGYEYKHRGPRSKFLPPVVPAAIQAELNDVLPNDLTVTDVRDHGKYIEIKLEANYDESV